MASSECAVFSGYSRWRGFARCDRQLSNRFSPWHDSRYSPSRPPDLFSSSGVVATVLSRRHFAACNCLSHAIPGTHSGFTNIWQSFSARRRAHLYRLLCVPCLFLLPRRYRTEAVWKIPSIFGFIIRGVWPVRVFRLRQACNFFAAGDESRDVILREGRSRGLSGSPGGRAENWRAGQRRRARKSSWRK